MAPGPTLLGIARWTATVSGFEFDFGFDLGSDFDFGSNFDFGFDFFVA